MDKLDTAVASHVEDRLLDPRRLTALPSDVLDRREDYIARRQTHVTEQRKRASEADAKLNRHYEAIENGIADLDDPALKGRVAELSPSATKPAPMPNERQARSNAPGRTSRKRR